VELRPGTHGTAAPHPLLSGLSLPQGMAFARVAGPDGALCVSDDTAGAVYRLAPSG
jgi:hypothetical protein